MQSKLARTQGRTKIPTRSRSFWRSTAQEYAEIQRQAKAYRKSRVYVLHQATVYTSRISGGYFDTLDRPGWKDFLRQLSTKYEMHVYTMGTRAYAEEVCAAIDPDGKIFGGRILSRDESESRYARIHASRYSYYLGLTQKSLQRLFPCDTSMVVIIDDRADVWEWSPNLIKVIPCGFDRYTEAYC